ncbi:DMT family transporter [Sphaerisporangium fuscum]|uniref:DMT family transporter n=1 Tax=Sphaerisporangium fuscum TaxID=2835868 RepID=UPI001BDC8E83|nr:EamA family transporter [Sphaerisporangium fuscum]
MSQPKNLSGNLSVLGAGVLWGTVGPAQVLTHSSAAPVTIGAARILFGGALLAAFVLLADRAAFRSLTRRAWPPLLAAAAATGIFQAAFMTSVSRTGAAVATALTFGIAPVSTGLCQRVVLKVPLTRMWAAGTAAAVTGVALMSVPGGSAHADPLGLALGIVAGGCFGVYTVSAKRLVDDRVPMPAAVSLTLLVGSLILLPWFLAGAAGLAEPRTAGLVAWLAGATTALAYMLFVTGLRRTTAATAATLSLAEPLVACLLGVLILGERMSPPVTAGALVLLGGLVLVSVPFERVRPRRARLLRQS